MQWRHNAIKYRLVCLYLLSLYWLCAVGSETEIAKVTACGRSVDSNTEGTDIGQELDCGQKNGSSTPCPDGTVYDPDVGECIQRKWRKKYHKRQTAIVGTPCEESIECQTSNGGAYCDSTKRCECLPFFVNINGYCWQKSNPGDACQYFEQCRAVSPNAYCGTDGKCTCNNNQPPINTIDGPFCLMPGECPTNGEFSKLRDPTAGTDIPCHRAGAGSCKDQDSLSNANEAVYNCLCPNPAPGVDPLMACTDPSVEISYCCPVRALACIQPKDEGTMTGSMPSQRWWFNSATNNCENLAYRGAGGNANNFQSKELCESYCKTACLRGNPLQTVGIQGTALSRCSTTSPCSRQDHYCHVEGRGPHSICCPNTDLVCSSTGGVIITDITLVVTVPDLGEATYNGRAVIRYYYDQASRQCLPFNYRGYGGTFNSFHTETECRQYCASTICPAGEPLRDSGGMLTRCGGQGTAVCPEKYECNGGGYCCPTANFVCTQPQAIGGCTSFSERWWFNPQSRACQRFSYSGCQGNFNNFETYQRCTDYCTQSSAKPSCPQGEPAMEGGTSSYIICSGAAVTASNCPANYYCYFDGNRYGCCPTRTKTCQLDGLDPGTSCIQPTTRWYYNSQTHLCEIFSYQGCDGNSNNFPTKIDCQDYCAVSGCPEGGEPYRETLNGQYRVCGTTTGTECPSGHTCNLVTLGIGQTFHYCCPTRSFICTMSQDQGQRCGTSTLNRYYFNPGTRTCEMFTYNGCGGNRNNFASVEACFSYCNSAGCPAGTVGYQSGKVMTVCSVNAPNTCPSGYNCVQSNVLQQGICCGSNAPIGACPAGQLAYMDSFTNAPLQCQPNVEGSCPNGIFCQYSFALQNSFCCSSSTAQCPQGGQPFTEVVGGQPRQCTPGLLNACPTGYFCQASTVLIGSVTSATGYCCGQASLCGVGYAVQVINNQPVQCVLNQVPSQCALPYICRANINTQQSYCCVLSPQASSEVCALGKEAYVVQGSPTLCTQATASTGCPPGYTCDLYQQTGSYYCCRFGTPIPPPGPALPVGPPNPCAPNNGFVYVNPRTQQPQECTLGIGIGSITGCPPDYRCAYSLSMRNYYCCSLGPSPSQPIVTAQCPSPLVSAPTASGQPQTCVLGFNTCPSGYPCTRTSAGTGLCCGQVGGIGTITPIGDIYGCPRGGNTYLYPGTRIPLACVRGGPVCPFGYSCQQSTRGNAWQCCSGFAGIDFGGVNFQETQDASRPATSSRQTQQQLSPNVVQQQQQQQQRQLQQQQQQQQRPFNTWHLSQQHSHDAVQPVNHWQPGQQQNAVYPVNSWQATRQQPNNVNTWQPTKQWQAHRQQTPNVLQQQSSVWQPQSSGRRSCSSNWDCRDSRGTSKLCVNHFCSV